jgi:5,10-methylene-tetrahydrofolate dehydrogenase/methenyl tetrahydrofolate cyclohydrolase
MMAVQSRRDTAGIIVQLPLPKQFDSQKILSYILPEVDIDCLTEINLGRLLLKADVDELAAMIREVKQDTAVLELQKQFYDAAEKPVKPVK